VESPVAKLAPNILLLAAIAAFALSKLKTVPSVFAASLLQEEKITAIQAMPYNFIKECFLY
jgi:hypothetical protein